jgi:DNA-binding Xre family transcriptional regulator
MPMLNKVKTFLEKRDLSAYQFIKETGIAPTTGYKLAKDPRHLPSITVLSAICDCYEIQPSELLEWVGDGNLEPN